MKKKGTGLKYIPLPDVSLIPRYLLEQIKPLDWDIDRFYKLGPQLIANKLNMMGVFADNDRVIKGFMWVTYNALTESLDGHLLSIDKEYQGMGILGEVKNLLLKMKKETNARKVIFTTTRPASFEKHGFKRSDGIKMEVA